MKFLHLSDTHIRKNFQTNPLTRRIFTKEENPALRFKKFLRAVKDEDYDFALVTGDLVHEGTVTDYQEFRKIWQENLPQLPYYFCRGSHDRQSSFASGMDVELNEEGNYLACSDFSGLRIISLDSAQEEHHEGKILDLQLSTLKNWLEVSAEKGTLLLLHHPLIWEEEGIASQTPAGFKEIIASSDVLGFFVGHIH